MRLSSRPGETNVPAIILSVAVLIVCLASAYYLIAVLPAQQSENAADEDAMSSSSSSVMSVMTQPSGMTGGATSSRAFDQAAYDACLNTATEAHNQRWAAACAQQRETQESAYLACVNQGRGEEYCQAQFGGYENIGSNCTLSIARTNALNVQFAAAKQSCNNQYGL